MMGNRAPLNSLYNELYSIGKGVLLFGIQNDVNSSDSDQIGWSDNCCSSRAKYLLDLVLLISFQKLCDFEGSFLDLYILEILLS